MLYHQPAAIIPPLLNEHHIPDPASCPGDIRESKTSTDLDVFDVHAGSEHGHKLLPHIHSHVLNPHCLQARFWSWVCCCGALVTGGRGKAAGVTFGIKSTNKQARNKKSPIEG